MLIDKLLILYQALIMHLENNTNPAKDNKIIKTGHNIERKILDMIRIIKRKDKLSLCHPFT